MDTERKIELVISTLQELEIKSTIGNLDRLLGSIQMLQNVKEELAKDGVNEPDIQNVETGVEPIPMEVSEIRNAE